MRSIISEHVKFISYDVEYPCLYSGELILEIDGKEYSFGNGWQDMYRMEHSNDFAPFWEFGGCIESYPDGEMGCDIEPWKIDYSKIPTQFQKYVKEIENFFNENTKWGCCGGCI